MINFPRRLLCGPDRRQVYWKHYQCYELMISIPIPNPKEHFIIEAYFCDFLMRTCHHPKDDEETIEVMIRIVEEELQEYLMYYINSLMIEKQNHSLMKLTSKGRHISYVSH